MPPPRPLRIVGAVALTALAGFIAFGYCFGQGEIQAAARASMKTDLRNLAYAESLHFALHGTYAGELKDLYFSGTTRFTLSPEVSLVVQYADSREWRATATHARSSETCTYELRMLRADAPPVCR